MSNMTLYDSFRKVPEEAKKKITGGRLNGFTDINPMWRIKKLTEQFGACGIGWYYDITETNLEKGANDEIAAFVKINLFVKHENEWSKPIQGIGGSMFVSKEKNGMYTSDECLKMALTDAISTSCKALGIGADVYFEKDKTKYDAKPEQKSEPKIHEEIIIEGLVLDGLKNAINECKSQDSLKKMWEANHELHKNSTFIKLVTDRKKLLTTNGID